MAFLGAASTSHQPCSKLFPRKVLQNGVANVASGSLLTPLVDIFGMLVVFTSGALSLLLLARVLTFCARDENLCAFWSASSMPEENPRC